jgi:Zn-dependent membrane protease YugP
MKHAKKINLHSPSYTACVLNLAMAAALTIALLGAIYKEQAFWAAGLVLFALIILYHTIVYYVNANCSKVSPDAV